MPSKKKRFSVEKAEYKASRKNKKVFMEMPLPSEENGNAFAIIGLFRIAAKDAGWDQSAINDVIDEAQSSDYTHLRWVILNHLK